MHLEHFILGYANNNGQHQINGNQLQSYPFSTPVQAVTDAANGDPNNNPSTFKAHLDGQASELDLLTLCP
jgi:hypothetical protein